jgi:hypothetical protein
MRTAGAFPLTSYGGPTPGFQGEVCGAALDAFGEDFGPFGREGLRAASGAQLVSTLAVDARAHDGDGLLIDTCRIPLLDDFEIALAFLVADAGLPAFLAQKVCGRC